ncbi:PadR family transcriptional regulator [Actinoplanes sp. CA-030573]|uniref:PadR family transcriptional regulator n=1 Tax=Actinoplanes sp. CA-030573 TaxID=3239898 RepID=UPI003D8C0C3A
MAFSQILLGLLEAKPKHGFALKGDYDARFGPDRGVGIGQVYAALVRLQRNGLAEFVGVEAGGGPDRRLYAITELGVEELSTWLTTPEPASSYARGVLFTKTVLALTSGRSPARVLQVQQSEYVERMRQVRRAADGGDVVDRLAADYEIAHLEAELRWIDLAGRRLAGPRAADGGH